jgi:hypothetical protein
MGISTQSKSIKKVALEGRGLKPIGFGHENIMAAMGMVRSQPAIVFRVGLAAWTSEKDLLSLD